SGVKVDYNTAGPLLSFDLLKALREGEIVSIQGDRVEGDVAQSTARLFNAEARMPNGPFVLALVAQAPIYPLFITRTGCRRYQIIVREPIRVHASGERATDIAKGAAQWCTALEAIIAGTSEQWIAFPPMFSR